MTGYYSDGDAIVMGMDTCIYSYCMLVYHHGRPIGGGGGGEEIL